MTVQSMDGRIASRVRKNRRESIKSFLGEHLGERFSSTDLHLRFGTAFRARVSEINRDPSSRIRIKNKTGVVKDTGGDLTERSVYWSEVRDVEDVGEESDFTRRRREEQARSAPLFAGVRP